MAIDILTLLCYRLPLIEENSTEIVTWRQLTAQFGNRGEPVYQFKDTFTDSIKLALRAYPEARVDLRRCGPSASTFRSRCASRSILCTAGRARFARLSAKGGRSSVCLN